VTVTAFFAAFFAHHSPRPHAPHPVPDPQGVPWAAVGVVVLVVASAAGIAYLVYWQRKQRRLGFAMVARQQGLTYTQDDIYGLLGEPFALFEHGDGRGIENVIGGTWHGVDVRVFDFWYYEESTDGQGHTSRTYYRFD